jgi:hypothetical protein
VRLEPVDLGSASPLIAAERTTFGKFRSERSTIVAAGFDPTLTADGAARLQLDLDTQLATAATAVPAELLDASSRSLLARLAPTDWSRPGDPLAVEELEALTPAFEHVLAAEGARNEERLHAAVHAWYAAGRAPRDLASLSAKVYTELFHTAASDPWLGLATPAAFSALPEDGLKLSDESRN